MFRKMRYNIESAAERYGTAIGDLFWYGIHAPSITLNKRLIVDCYRNPQRHGGVQAALDRAQNCTNKLILIQNKLDYFQKKRLKKQVCEINGIPCYA